MRGQLYHGHANATALFSSPVVSALGSESDNPGSSPGRDRVVREKIKKNLNNTLKACNTLLFSLVSLIKNCTFVLRCMKLTL